MTVVMQNRQVTKRFMNLFVFQYSEIETSHLELLRFARWANEALKFPTGSCKDLQGIARLRIPCQLGCTLKKNSERRESLNNLVTDRANRETLIYQASQNIF